MHFKVDLVSVLGSHGSFDRLSKIYVGGGYTENDQIVEGFDGIIGGGVDCTLWYQPVCCFVVLKVVYFLLEDKISCVQPREDIESIQLDNGLRSLKKSFCLRYYTDKWGYVLLFWADKQLA